MRLLLLLTITSLTSGFAPSNNNAASRTNTELAAESRRDIFGKIAVTTGAASFLLSSPAAFAAVGEGTELPNGVAQFSRVIKTKSGIKRLQKRILESSADFDKKDWDGVDVYMRKIYSTGDDLKSLTPKGKGKEADKIIQELKDYSKAAEASITAKDGKALVAVLTKCDTLYQQFLDLQNDVPDTI